MNEHLSINRLWWLLRADLAGGYRSLLTVSGTLAAVILIASLISFEPTGSGQGFFVSWYGAMLYVWGIIASSRAFGELHDKTRNGAYLLIPASAIEKTAARLLTVTVGLAVYLLVFTAVVSLLIQGMFWLLPGAGYGPFNPLDPQLWPLIAGYLFLQSFYFLGAAWFRNRHFIKTSLVIILAGIAWCAVVMLLLMLVFLPGNMADLESLVVQASVSYRSLFRPIEILVATLAILLPAACWTIAWLRVRETQVSDGI